jgi:hypothetical protein
MAQILLFCFAGRISAMYGKQVMRALYSPGLRMAYALPRNASAF